VVGLFNIAFKIALRCAELYAFFKSSFTATKSGFCSKDAFTTKSSFAKPSLTPTAICAPLYEAPILDAYLRLQHDSTALLNSYNS